MEKSVERSVGDIIAAAGAEFDKGWCQDELEDEHGRVCAVGAINRVVTGHATHFCAIDLGVFSALVRCLPAEFVVSQSGHSHPNNLVVQYNNTPGRTVEEMREWFAKAAANEGVTL